MTDVADAVAALARGGVVVFPTETVWGLGVRLDRPDAVARIFELKDRDRSKPLQVLLPGPEDVSSVAAVTPGFEALAGFMPGPLTVVLPAKEGLPDLGDTSGTVGVRVPDHPIALALLAEAGPMAATSANRSGSPTPTDLDGVRAVFGDDVDAYLDGEPAPRGAGSTVLDLTGPDPVVLRVGDVPAERIASALGRPVAGA